MLGSSLSLIDRIISLKQESDKNKRTLFIDHIDPIFKDIAVINSSRRLENMGLIGTIYYYAQLDIGKKVDSTMIDRLSKKLGIAELREYIGIRD